MKSEGIIICTIKSLKASESPSPGNAPDEKGTSFLQIIGEMLIEDYIFSQKKYVIRREPCLIKMRGGRATETYEKIRVGDVVAFRVRLGGSYDKAGGVTNQFYGEHAEYLYTPNENDNDDDNNVEAQPPK